MALKSRIDFPQALHGRMPAMRGSVVHDTEDPAGRPVRLGPHDLLDESTKGVDASLFLPAAEDSTAANIPSSQVLRGTTPVVLMLSTRIGRPGPVGGVAWQRMRA